jgi:glycerophosphoryl diester phosphodiesterase
MRSTPLILGHRGASAVAPENTLAAFSRALRDGADGVEFDVRLSRDLVPVVIHDTSLRRTGLTDSLVCELTSAELGKIDVGSWFDQSKRNPAESFASEKLPTLARVFEFFNLNGGLLYVEMKCDEGQASTLALQVATLIQEFRMADRVVVESFDLLAIAAVKRTDSGIRTAALFEPKLTRPFSTVRRLKTVELALRCGADEIALHHTIARRRVIEKAKRDGLQIVVWTVDHPEWILRARTQGIKGLITNNPATMVRYRDASTLEFNF